MIMVTDYFPRTACPVMFCPFLIERVFGQMYSRWCDCSVAFLSCCVPNLSLYGFTIHLDASSSELHANGALALQVELIACETGQQVTLPHTRVSNEHHCKTQQGYYADLCYRLYFCTPLTISVKTVMIAGENKSLVKSLIYFD